MKIINDTEVYEPSECCFAITHDDDGITVLITPISFWDENHCLDDGFGDHSLEENVSSELERKNIWNACESMWTSELIEDATREVLVELGFVESQEMHDL